MKEGQASITVVVPNYNQRKLLRACLRSLRRQTHPCRVLVVDDGSEDGSASMVEQDFPEFRCLRLSSNVGFAAAANAGMRRVETEFTALLNNDAEADPEWIAAGLRAFQRLPRHGMLASKMIDSRDCSRLDSAGDLYNRRGMPLKRGNGCPASDFEQEAEVLGASGGAAFYRTSMLRRLGYFDESFHMYLEDVDLSLRARLAGYRCRFIPQAVVYHLEAGSDPLRKPGDGPGVYYSPSRVYWITRNRWRLMWTYQPLSNFPWLALGWTKSALFHLLKAGYLGSFLKGTAAGWAALPNDLGKRRRLFRHSRISRSELWKLFRA
ncbi:MAG TPA: glycosyltransferase family 2 protein [Acidobacteriota bacterium]|nr:glycosyltransferase family 2 protein [Acidobacteriota bacterium]